jgi:glutamine phosphoribosylpyrophosphate amidotransferase
MCGIFAVFGFSEDQIEFRQRCTILSKKLRHRGPDWSGVSILGNNILCHERLAIVGVGIGYLTQIVVRSHCQMRMAPWFWQSMVRSITMFN